MERDENREAEDSRRRAIYTEHRGEADAVRKAVQALNAAISSASASGLEVRLSVEEVERVGTQAREWVTVRILAPL